jgi:integrase
MASLVKIWIARYVDKEGRRVPKGLPGAKKVRERSTVWYGQIKVNGKYKRVPLFSDKEASRVRLAEMVKDVERGEVGLVRPNKDALAQPVDEHVAAYIQQMRLRGDSEKHISERERILRTVLEACEIKTLADLTTDRVEDYLAHLQKKPTPNNANPGPVSARTKDTHRGAVHAFAEWCVSTRPKRLTENPIAAVVKPKGEVQRPRRAETVENLKKLLLTAAERPLLEALTVRKGPRAGERYADVRPEVRERLLLEGRERSLLYKTAILTGMRQGELARLLVWHLRLDGDDPAVFVAPAHNRKNKVGVWLPLLKEHADELAAWIKDTAKKPEDAVFYVPEKPNKIFRRDLEMAGIAYKDKTTGCYFDFHSLRHCTDTYLNGAGVPPSVVMLFMRHKTLRLSLITYNDPRMHDARKALAALPKLA